MRLRRVRINKEVLFALSKSDGAGCNRKLGRRHATTTEVPHGGFGRDYNAYQNKYVLFRHKVDLDRRFNWGLSLYANCRNDACINADGGFAAREVGTGRCV